ncbi:MAG: adenylosuccinate synthetase [Flavobacteriaceae bacterium]
MATFKANKIIQAMQIPTDVPGTSENTPIDLSSPVDIILFIVSPILMIVFYLLYRRMKKKEEASKNDSDE